MSAADFHSSLVPRSNKGTLNTNADIDETLFGNESCLKPMPVASLQLMELQR